MAIDGTYKIEIESPMGAQEIKPTFKAIGHVLEGSSESSYGTSRFTGKVKGGEVSWDYEVNGPLGKMDLSFNGKIKGDDFTGNVKAGMFGAYPFKGRKI